MTSFGCIQKWNEDKGYGFLRPSEGGKDVFIHAKDLPVYQRRPRVGDRVSFIPQSDDRGRSRASKPRLRGLTTSPGVAILISLGLAAAGFTALMYGGVLPRTLTTTLIGVYLVGSSITFLAYLRDKHRAVRGGWRTPEQTLHVLEFLGGWPGALVAQRVLRHKNRKLSYQVGFWLIVAVHVAFWMRSLWLPLVT